MRLSGVFLFLIFICFFTPTVFAESSHVLPYPSFMPGNVFYSPKETIDNLKQYFYFGDFAQFKYHLAQSDKYLVEAKTLFEYKQYLLAVKSLSNSDEHIRKASTALFYANRNNKILSEKQNLLREAALKHIEILQDLEKIVPSSFLWNPEKGVPTDFSLEKIINNSILLRNSCL